MIVNSIDSALAVDTALAASIVAIMSFNFMVSSPLFGEAPISPSNTENHDLEIFTQNYV
jgi:hypothetical protein